MASGACGGTDRGAATESDSDALRVRCHRRTAASAPLTAYRIDSDPRADSDVEAAFAWYEQQRPGLGDEFLDDLQAAYTRIVDGPLRYQVLRGDVRYCLLRRFPYAVYFTVNGEVISIFAVVHSRRDQSEWQRRQS